MNIFGVTRFWPDSRYTDLLNIDYVKWNILTCCTKNILWGCLHKYKYIWWRFLFLPLPFIFLKSLFFVIVMHTVCTHDSTVYLTLNLMLYSSYNVFAGSTDWWPTDLFWIGSSKAKPWAQASESHSRVLLSIRSKFPSLTGVYTGYKEIEDALDL